MFMRSRAELLDSLARMGPASCVYNVGTDLEAWLHGPCDCKYGGQALGTPHEAGNGCPELRSLYALLQAMTDDEYKALVSTAGGLVLGLHGPEGP